MATIILRDLWHLRAQHGNQKEEPQKKEVFKVRITKLILRKSAYLCQKKNEGTLPGEEREGRRNEVHLYSFETLAFQQFVETGTWVLTQLLGQFKQVTPIEGLIIRGRLILDCICLVIVKKNKFIFSYTALHFIRKSMYLGKGEY